MKQKIWHKVKEVGKYQNKVRFNVGTNGGGGIFLMNCLTEVKKLENNFRPMIPGGSFIHVCRTEVSMFFSFPHQIEDFVSGRHHFFLKSINEYDALGKRKKKNVKAQLLSK